MLALSIGDVRDWIFIIFFGAGSVLIVFWLLASYLIFRKFGGVLNGIRGNLDSTKTTLEQRCRHLHSYHRGGNQARNQDRPASSLGPSRLCRS